MWTRVLLLLGLLILVIVLAALVIGYLISAPRYKGPISDHFNGKTFYNLNGAKAKGVREVISWMLTRHQGPWPSYHNDPPGPPPPARVEGRTVRVTFVNHSTVLLQFDGLNVLTDPVYYERVSPFQFAGPKRNNPPGIRFDDLPKIDLLILSHNHWDHLDIGTVRKLCERDHPRIFCPLGVKAFLENEGCQNVQEMDWRQSVAYNDSTTIHCVPAQHFSGRGLFDRDATLWAGFIIESKTAGKLYFVGDTGYGPFLKEIGRQFGPLRLALIPIGAYKPKWFMSPIHCSPDEAVQIHEDLRSEQSIAIHFGTFPLADDGAHEPVDELTRALAAKNIPTDQFQVLKTGASRVLN